MVPTLSAGEGRREMHWKCTSENFCGQLHLERSSVGREGVTECVVVCVHVCFHLSEC